MAPLRGPADAGNDDCRMTTYTQIEAALAPHGLMARGGFVPAPEEGLAAATVVLVGNAGPGMFARFSEAPEYGDGTANALDTWTRRVLTVVARDLNATPLFPFDGPPWPPFQQWAMRAEPVAPSPLGMLIHPVYGLWHAYRGALAFAAPVNLPEIESVLSPCESCADKPCLSACPVNAFAASDQGVAYDVSACAEHVSSEAGDDCLQRACRARRACPVGRAYHYTPQQAHFHMAAFLTARRREAVS
jgi:hypothetical protein